MEEPMSAKHLPRTDSIRELAHFWDSHDLTDFDEELEEVNETVFQRQAAITVPLRLSEAEAIHEMAKSKGLADVELVRGWLLERIASS
jgi:CopG antitoxin of type II toxin-antitoxin system